MKSLRRILSVPAIESRNLKCQGCNRLVPHAWATYYLRGESGELVSGSAARPYPHRAPCGKQCGRSSPVADYHDGDAVHFAETCGEKHPREGERCRSQKPSRSAEQDAPDV